MSARGGAVGGERVYLIRSTGLIRPWQIVPLSLTAIPEPTRRRSLGQGLRITILRSDQLGCTVEFRGQSMPSFWAALCILSF